MGTLRFITDTGGSLLFDFQVEFYESEYLVPNVGNEISLDVVAGTDTKREDLVKLISASGEAAYGTDINGVGWFVDRLPSGSQYASIAIGVEPINLPEMDGVYGVVTGGEDRTLIPGSNRPQTIDVFVLSDYAEYASLTDMQNDLGVGVP